MCGGFFKFDIGSMLMRASVAGLLAACALIGIPRLASELREYRKETQQPAPLAISAPPESRPVVSAAPVPKIPDLAALPKPAPTPKISDAAVLPKLAPVQRISMLPDFSPPARAGTRPATQANEAELIPAIQKELTRLSYYDGPITDQWTRPVRGAAREFLRKTGSRARHPQPTAGLLAMLQAAETVKEPVASPAEGAPAEQKPVPASGPSVKEMPSKQNAVPSESGAHRTESAKEAPAKQNAATPVPAAQNDDYLPPWMTAKTEQGRLASKSEAAHMDDPPEARRSQLSETPSGFDEPPKRRFHRRHARRHYVSHRGYYSRRRSNLFPF
jgi:hypothetical protein